MKKTDTATTSFEESIARLERIVSQLQNGDLPLDRALQLFEEGVNLSRQCQTQLEVAERKVEILLREKGEVRVVPFEGTGRNSPGDQQDSDDDDDEDDDDLPF
jgi:exodeoxyribonuclease VII small subunit